MQPQTPPENLLAGLSTQVPIALLPVRLETRFGTRTEAAGGPAITTLRVRIYPDDLSIAKGTPACSDAELTAAATFWQAQQAHAGATPDDAAARAAAWELYVRHVGPAKAVRLARQTRDGAVPAGATAGGDVPGAVLLPDAWVLVGEDDAGQTAFVHHLARVPGDLPVAPAGRAGDALNPADALLLPRDDPARWVSDFDAALVCGMAAEIDLETAEQASSGARTPAALNGLRSLYAFGVNSSDPDATAVGVAALLANHADGAPLGFVAQGAATNNLGTAASAWSAGRDEFAGFRFVTETPEPPAAIDTAVDALAGGAADGAIFEAALGLPQGTAAAFDGAGGHEAWLSRNFSRAFFPVTLGQVLGDLARHSRENSDSDSVHARLRQETLLFARNHATSFVRSNGPVQPLRIGANPYGILPVMATSGWQALDGEDSRQGRLLEILDTLRWYFQHAAGSVPTLSGGTGDPASTMLSIFGRSAVPHEGGWWLQDLVGPLMSMAVPPVDVGAMTQPVDVHAMPNPLAFQMQALTAILADKSIMVGRLGADAVRRLVSATLGGYFDGSLFVEMSKTGQKPVLRAVAQTVTRAGKEVTPSNYLEALLQRSTFPFRLAAVPDPNPPDDLLYVVAERALEAAGELDANSLLGIINANKFNMAMALPPEVARSSEPVALAVAKDFTTKLSAVSSAPELLTTAGAGMSIHDAVWNESVTINGGVLASEAVFQPWQEVNTLAGTRGALRVLAGAKLSDGDYTRLTSETLAASSHRLDAWYTSLATSRLATLRRARPQGLHAGSWGVLVNIRPQSTAAGAQNPLAGVAGSGPQRWQDHLLAHGAAVPGELRLPQNPLGYVHAPSLAQAVTAGVLRAAEAAHAGSGSSLAGIDLTSKRVRTALDIVAAMQHGQPLAALLGQQFERNLHAAGAHTAVAVLRQEFPQRRVAGKAGEPAAGDDAVVPAEVLDGLDAREARGRLASRVDLGPIGQALQDLDDTVESVADLMVADGVHQLATGRLESAGASFAAAADGAAPPEITVAAEPRSGVTITHRLMLSVDGESGAGDDSGWDDGAPRARLAGGAERWARGMLGPAGSWTGVPAGVPGAPGVSPAALGLCALDVVAESVALPGGGCALDARCSVAPVLLLMARAVAGVLGQARPAVPADLDYPDPAASLASGRVRTAPAPGPAELSLLVDALVAQLRAVVHAIDGVLAAAATAADGSSVPVPLPDVQLPSGLLAPLAAWGLPGCVVPEGTMSSEQALAAASSAGAVVRDVFTLIRQGLPNTATSAAPADAIREVGVDNWEEALALVAQSSTGLDTLVRITRRLGGDAVVPTLALALDGPAVAGVSQVQLQRWLVRTARVRPAMADFVDLCSFAEAAGHSAPGLTAMHLPPTDGLAWLGGPLAEAGRPEDADPETAAGSNKLRRWRRPAQPHVHAVVSGLPVADGAPVHLLVLDEVAEVLPAPTVATGLAINYNAPNARAPQSILLAVHPNPAEPWTWQLVLETVREAMALVRIRGVDLDDLQPTGLGEYLPLIYLPDPPDSGLPLTPLNELTEERILRLMTVKAYRNVRLAP